MSFPLDAPKKIREKMDAGLLPHDAPSKMYGGFGKRELCSGCETPILPTRFEYEFDSDDGRKFRFHLGCAGLWEAERWRGGADRANTQRAVEPKDRARPATGGEAKPRR
jgi:hypothetical protein